MGTTAISNNINIDDQYKGPGPPQFKFLPTNLNVQAGRNFSGFVLTGEISGPHLIFLSDNTF